MDVVYLILIGLVISRLGNILMCLALCGKVSWREILVGGSKKGFYIILGSDVIAILGMWQVLNLHIYGIAYSVVGFILMLMLLFTWITDMKEMLILNVYTYPGMVLLLMGVLFFAQDYVWWVHIGGGILVGVLLLTLYVLSKGKLGMGDIKLMIGLGFYFGIFDIIPVLMLASISGLVVGLILLKVRGKSTYYPFGPFIVLGSMIVWLSGFSLVG